MTDAFPALTQPGRAPVAIFRVHYLERGWRNERSATYRDYDDEGHMKRALSRLRGYHGMDCITRIDLIAAAPIDVTGSYTK